MDTKGPQIEARLLLALSAQGCPPCSATAGIEALLGFAADQFLSGSVRFRDRVHADDRALFEGLFSPTVEPVAGSVNLRLRNAAGRVVCVKADYEKRAGENAQIFLDLLLEDVRTIANPGDALLLANFKTLIEDSGDFIYVKNRNHVFLGASQALALLTDAVGEPAYLAGKTDYDLYPENMADISYRLERQAFAERRRANEIQQWTAADGTRRWIDNRKYPINGSDGRIAGILGVAPDITEYIEAEHRRRESEAALRENKNLLQLFIEHAPAALAMLDREMRYLAVSQRWMESHGLQGREIIGHSHYEIFPHLPQSWKDEHRRALAGETIPLGEISLPRTDGSLQWFSREIRPWFTGENQIGGIIIFGEDITEKRQAEAALRESQEKLRLFVEHAPVALAMFDREMRYLMASEKWLESFGLTDRAVIGLSHYELNPELPERLKEVHRRGLTGESLDADEDRIKRTDGKVVWSRWKIVPWRKADGSVGGIVVFSEDITARKEMEEELRLAASVFTGAREGITITDPDGTILDVNDSFTRITGYTREEAAGKNPRILQSGLQSLGFYENMWRSLIEEGGWSGEIWNRNKSGDIYLAELTINAILDVEGKTQKYVGHFSDVTQLKEQTREMERMAQYDALTGLPNRALFRDRLRQAMAHARQRSQLLAVAYIDLDGFAAINDEYGQETGDRMLTALAKRMSFVLREGDTLAKLAGDEFAVVLPDLARSEDALPAVNRLLHAAARQVHIGKHAPRVSASIGVALYPGGAKADEDQLLLQAVDAMHQAKLAGRNRYHIFDPAQGPTLRGRQKELKEIRRALNRNEFVLHYQPKVNMRTGKLVGVEALIRWQHPKRGLLAPAAFLPVIADHPLALELGKWVINSVLAQIEAWRETGLKVSVSVNIGAEELQQEDFVEWLRRLLAAHPGVEPAMLELELLETTALQDMARTSMLLEACRQMDVSFALDDFGTGYSSLTYLKRLPVKVLKIDQSFVREMDEEPESLGILEAVLGLATAFRREVVAEGVETVEHGLMLLQLGCEIAQGYGIARPMPADDLPGWVTRWRPDLRWAASAEICSDNRPLLYASVEHRVLMGALESYLQGKRHAPPPLDSTECRFGSWLQAERQAGRAHFPAFRAIETLHEQLHQLAMEILDLRLGGRDPEGLARLGVLHGLRDEFLERLTALN